MKRCHLSKSLKGIVSAKALRSEQNGEFWDPEEVSVSGAE